MSYRRSAQFPNGTVYTHVVRRVQATFRKLYELFRPHKGKDFRRTIPQLVYETEECVRGFLQGIFVAEGSVVKRRIELTSKHPENLTPVRDLLKGLGIESSIYASRWPGTCSRLFIYGKENMLAFRDLVGLRLETKRTKLHAFLKQFRPA